MNTTAEILVPTLSYFKDDGQIDEESTRKAIEFLIRNGVDGFVPMGSSGEFTTLSLDERKKMIDIYTHQNGGRGKIIAGVTQLRFPETVQLANYALESGVDGVLILPPYYYEISDDEVYRYYKKLSEEIQGDIYIYNFAARTGYDISTTVLKNLVVDCSNIVGIKDTNVVPAHTVDMIRATKEERPDFKVYSGFDNHFVLNVLSGGVGCIGALSNLFPQQWHDWIYAYQQGDMQKVGQYQKAINALMGLYNLESNFPKLFKTIQKERGLEVGDSTIAPFDLLSKETWSKAKEYLEEAEGYFYGKRNSN